MSERHTSAHDAEGSEGRIVAEAVARGFRVGGAPLKIVTGRQETTGLSFDLKPGAIVAFEGSAVIFVCG